MYETHLCSLLLSLLEENIFPALRASCKSFLLLGDSPDSGAVATSVPPSGSDGRFVITGEEVDLRSTLITVHPLYQLLSTILRPQQTSTATAALSLSGTDSRESDREQQSHSRSLSTVPLEITQTCEVIRSSLSVSSLHLVCPSDSQTVPVLSHLSLSLCLSSLVSTSSSWLASSTIISSP